MNFTEITSIIGIGFIGYAVLRLVEFLLLKNYNKKKEDKWNL